MSQSGLSMKEKINILLSTETLHRIEVNLGIKLCLFVCTEQHFLSQ